MIWRLLNGKWWCLAGLAPAEFALYSLHVGGATHLSAARVTSGMLQNKDTSWTRRRCTSETTTPIAAWCQKLSPIDVKAVIDSVVRPAGGGSSSDVIGARRIRTPSYMDAAFKE